MMHLGEFEDEADGDAVEELLGGVEWVCQGLFQDAPHHESGEKPTPDEHYPHGSS